MNLEILETYYIKKVNISERKLDKNKRKTTTENVTCEKVNLISNLRNFMSHIAHMNDF